MKVEKSIRKSKLYIRDRFEDVESLVTKRTANINRLRFVTLRTASSLVYNDSGNGQDGNFARDSAGLRLGSEEESMSAWPKQNMRFYL